MSIRAPAIAVFVLAWLLAGCRADTPTPVPAATPLPTLTAPPTPTSLPIPTPVPIATWVAQGIPSDLEIGYSWIEGPEFGEFVRITADGSATYTIYGVGGKQPGGIEGKLSPEVLRRVISAFEDKRFFYLALADGCVVDVASPRSPSKPLEERLVSPPSRSVSIRINGVFKEITRREGVVYCPGNSGDANFLSLIGILKAAVKDLPSVMPTVEPGPTVTLTRPGD